MPEPGNKCGPRTRLRRACRARAPCCWELQPKGWKCVLEVGPRVGLRALLRLYVPGPDVLEPRRGKPARSHRVAGLLLEGLP